MKNIFKFLALVLIFTSCKNASLMKRKYTDGYYFSKSTKIKTKKSSGTIESKETKEVSEKVFVRAKENKTNSIEPYQAPHKLIASTSKKSYSTNIAKPLPLSLNKYESKNKLVKVTKSETNFKTTHNALPYSGGQGGGGFIGAMGGAIFSFGLLFLYLGALTAEPALLAIGIGLMAIGFLLSFASLLMVFNVFPGI